MGNGATMRENEAMDNGKFMSGASPDQQLAKTRQSRLKATKTGGIVKAL
jgi:hypothetical protein